MGSDSDFATNLTLELLQPRFNKVEVTPDSVSDVSQ